MGYIYIIKTTQSDKVYIGQTTGTLSHRWCGHKTSYRVFAKIREDTVCTKRQKEVKHSALYAAMHKYGLETFTINMLEEAPKEKLNEREIHYIKYYNSLSPGGYNLTHGGTEKFTFSSETLERMSESSRKYISENLDNFRREETKGLPMYTTFKIVNNYSVYAVNMHPKCKFKTFSEKTYGTPDAAKTALIDFMKTLNDMPYEKPKAGDKLPAGLSKLKTGGYLVRKRHNLKTYEKKFAIQAVSDEENYKNAIIHLEKINNIIETLKTSSETKC